MYKNKINLRKVVAIAICLAVTTMFSGCDKDNGNLDNSNNPTVPEGGVLINGVVWAKCNVDEVGTFAPTPESKGKFYQWNIKKAWSATGEVTGWEFEYEFPAGTKWTKANDPSPTGWRVPTLDEIKSLLNTSKVDRAWDNTKKGYTFTDKTTKVSIFLPAVGSREWNEGVLSGVCSFGYYWCNEEYNGNGFNIWNASYLTFYNDAGVIDANWSTSICTHGFCVRSVAE